MKEFGSMLADRYIRTDFVSQEDFEQNFSLRVPKRFHFAYDVVDEYARISPETVIYEISALSALANKPANA